MKEPIQPEDIKKGDLIRKEYTSPEFRRNRAHEYVAEYDGDGWVGRCETTFLLDRPKPPVVLPTDLGVYADVNGGVWEFSEHGYLVLHVAGCAGWFTAEHMEQFAPFTRLEPVAETAKRVLDRVGAWFFGTCGPMEETSDDLMDRLRKEFEVEK